MKNPIKRYYFWLKILAAALLLALGMWIIFDSALGDRLVLAFTSLVIVIFAVIRVIPLLKTLKSGKSKSISMLEILVNLAIGVLMFYGAVVSAKDGKENEISTFAVKYYNFLVGGILYLRGLVYFMVSILYKEESDKTKFWGHVVILTLGVICVGLNKNLASQMSLAIAIIALICGAALVVEGGFSYGKYRKYVQQTREVNEVKTIVDEEIDKAPTKGKKKDKKIEEPAKNDQPKNDPASDSDRPYVA